MTLTVRIASCLFVLMAAIAIFVAAVFMQSGIEAGSYSPILLFGLSVALFMVANYYGLLVRNQVVESNRARRRA